MSAPTLAVLLALAVGVGAALMLAGGLAVLGIALVVRLVILRDEARAAERASAILRNIEQTRAAPDPLTRSEIRTLDEVMMTLASQRERLDEDLGRLKHFIDGGRFNDSPNRWKNQQENKR